MHSMMRESEQRGIYRGNLYREKGKSQPQSTILSDYLVLQEYNPLEFQFATSVPTWCCTLSSFEF